jgi:hypothetical protein
MTANNIYTEPHYPTSLRFILPCAMLLFTGILAEVSFYISKFKPISIRASSSWEVQIISPVHCWVYSFHSLIAIVSAVGYAECPLSGNTILALMSGFSNRLGK